MYQVEAGLIDRCSLCLELIFFGGLCTHYAFVLHAIAAFLYNTHYFLPYAIIMASTLDRVSYKSEKTEKHSYQRRIVML
jgi:glutamate racemase